MSDRDAIPPEALGALLQETETLRRRNEQLDADLKRRRELSGRGGTVLALLGEAMIVPLVVAFGLTVALHLGSTWEVPSAFALWVLLTLLVLALLGHYELPVPGARRVAPWLAGGWQAVRSDLAKSVASQPHHHSTKANTD